METDIGVIRVMVVGLACILILSKITCAFGETTTLESGSSFSMVEDARNASLVKGTEECWIAAEIFPLVKCVRRQNTCSGAVTLEDSQICNVCNRGAN
jgi:hypothetical protein